MATLEDQLSELPVAGWLSPDDIEQLRAANFDIDAFHQLPLEGPISPAQLLRLAPRLGEVVDFVNGLALEGPLTADELESLVGFGTDEVIRFQDRSMGHVTARALLDALRNRNA